MTIITCLLCNILFQIQFNPRVEFVDCMGELVHEEEYIKCAEQVANETRNVFADPWEYITCFYGPQRLNDLSMAIGFTVVNALILITGLVGNIAVCVVIVKQPKLHTPTNYYLFNLAISDVTLLVSGLPHELSCYWQQYPWVLGSSLCKMRALISEMSSYVSVLTIVAFSTERYIGICYPLYRGVFSGIKRVICTIGIIWLIAFASAIPFAISTQIHYVDFPFGSGRIIKESAICAMVSQPANIPLSELSTFIFFVLPFCILAVQYTSMGIAISRASKNTIKGGEVRGSVHRKTQANKNTIRMLSFIVLAFFLCWAPFHLQRVLSIYMGSDEDSDKIKNWVYVITGIFYYFSPTANPILYNIMSDRMRSGFEELFCRTERRKSQTSASIRRSNISAGGTMPVRSCMGTRILAAPENADFSPKNILSNEEQNRLLLQTFYRTKQKLSGEIQNEPPETYV